MLVSVNGCTDVLIREQGESLASFQDKVRQYQESTQCGVDAFCSHVGVRGVTIADTVELSAYLRRGGPRQKEAADCSKGGRRHVLF